MTEMVGFMSKETCFMREKESERYMILGSIESLSTLGDFAFGSVTCPGPSGRG
jgi:hypothetical protein